MKCQPCHSVWSDSSNVCPKCKRILSDVEILQTRTVPAKLMDAILEKHLGKGHNLCGACEEIERQVG